MKSLSCAINKKRTKNAEESSLKHLSWRDGTKNKLMINACRADKWLEGLFEGTKKICFVGAFVVLCYGTSWRLHSIFCSFKSSFFTWVQNLRRKNRETNKMRVNINSLFPVIPLGATEVVIKNSPFYWKSFSVCLHSTDQREELFVIEWIICNLTSTDDN